MKSLPCLLCVSILIAGGGCGWFESSTAQNGDRKTVSVTFDQAAFERDRAEFQRRSEQQLAELDRNIADLEARAKTATGQLKADLDAEIARQKMNLEKAREELQTLQNATAEKWAEFKARSSAAMDDLRKGLKDAASRFQ